jgi:iron complex outermembrane receptor protein
MFRSFFLSSAAGIALIAAASPLQAQIHSGSVETLVVTASPINGDPEHLVSIPAKVDAEDILRNGGSNLTDSLINVPGISGSGFATGASRPIIRGMDSNRVRILEDGTSSSDASDIGPDHGIPVGPMSARSIEVVRGAATLRYGSQAIGGVVNAINNRVPLDQPDKPGLEAVSSYESVSNAGQIGLQGDTSVDDFAIHADGYYRHADGYDTPLGSQPNSFFRGDGASVGSSYFFGDGNRIGAAVVHYDAKYGVPSDTTYIDMRQAKMLTGSSLNIGEGVFKTLNITTSYGNYEHKERNPDGSVNSTFKNKEFDGRAEALLDTIGPFTNTAVGIEIQNRQFRGLGEASDYLLPAITQNYAGFLFTEVPLGTSLHLEGSARVEQVYIEGTPASDIYTRRDYTPISGAVGLLYTVSDSVKVGLAGSSTARAPGQTELFSRGAHDGPQTFETGDPDLKIERVNSVEATMRVRYQEFTFDGSVYSNYFNNYIYGALTGLICEDDGTCAIGGPGELRELRYTQLGAHFRGLEGKASYDLWHIDDGILKIDMMGDYVRATLAGGDNVPRIPPWRLGGGLSWESPKLDAGFQVQQVGKQNYPGVFDTSTPGFVSVNAQIAWRPFTSNSNIEIALMGRNLADTVQRNAAALNKDLVVSPGRNIQLSVRYATN